MEVLNFFVERKSKLSSLCNCPLGQMSNIFVTGPRLRWSFLPLEVKQFTNSFEVFFQPFQNFSSKGNLKAARGAAGNKFSGVVPPLFP